MTTSPPTVPAPPPAADALPDGAWLPPLDGHRCWWAEGGDPRGAPVLVVHGGPGGASRTDAARWFADQPVRWIVIDQRGCGRSTPLGETAHNDLPALLLDMERLREQLGLARWALLGGSWGAAVALAYAQRHPQRVSGVLLRSPFFATAAEAQRYVAPWEAWLGDAGRGWVGEPAARALSALYQGATSATALQGISRGALASERLARAWSAYDDQQSAAGGVVRSGAVCRPDALTAATPELLAAWRVHAHFALDAWTGSAPWFDPWLAARSLASAQLPLGLVWGADDATCDPAAARVVAAVWEQGACAEVPGAGHRISDPQLGPALQAEVRAWAQRLPRAA